MAENCRSALVAIPQDSARQTAAALLSLAGFQVRANLTAEGAADAFREDQIDIVVASDHLCGQRGFDALAGRPSILSEGRVPRRDRFAVLLCCGAVGFAPGWYRRTGFDAVLPMRSSGASWTQALAEILLQRSISNEARASLNAVVAGSKGFSTLSQSTAGLSYIAAAHPPDLVLPILERKIDAQATASVDPDVIIDVAIRLGPVGFDTLARVAESKLPTAARVRAIDALAKRAPSASVLAVARSLVSDASVGWAAADAVLDVVASAGPSGFEELRALAEATTIGDAQRSRAVQALIRTAPSEYVQPLVAAWATGDDPVLADCSLTPFGPPNSVVTATLDAQQPRHQRLRALRLLGTDGPHDIAATVLNQLLVDRDEAVRAAAVEWSVRRPDIDSADALAVAQTNVALQKAAMLGASLGGRSAWQPLSEIASTSRDDVRARALRLLALRFGTQAKSVVQAALLERNEAVGLAAVQAARSMGPAGIGLLRLAVDKAFQPAVIVAAFEALVAQEGSREDPAVRRALVDVAAPVQQAGLRYVVRVADDMLPSLLDKVVKANRPDFVTAVIDGLVQAGPGGFDGLVAVVRHEGFSAAARHRAMNALRGGHAADVPKDLDGPEAWEVAETVPAVPAPPPVLSAHAESSGRRPASDPQAVVLPAAPRPAQGRRRDRGPRMLSLARAQEALAVALQSGQDGFRALRTLAESARVPDEVRVQAIRHLGADFPDRDVRWVLESALESDRPEVKTAAFGALMVRSDVRLAPVAKLARDSAGPIGLRMRAARFLGTRWTKRQARSDLEALLDSEHEGLQRVALEGLFPSMCYTPPEKVEARLINLLQSHGVATVRASAARALGVFGSDLGLAALDAVDSWRLPVALRTAVDEAKRRLQSTIGDASRVS